MPAARGASLVLAWALEAEAQQLWRAWLSCGIWNLSSTRN